MVDDAPLNGELVFTDDDTYSTVRINNMYPVGSNVYLRLTAEGLVPISNITLLSMRFVWRGEEHRVGGNMYDEDWNCDLKLNPCVPTTEKINPMYHKNVMKWYLYLHEDRIIEPTPTDSIRIIVRIEVTYEQTQRRMLYELESRGLGFYKDKPMYSPSFEHELCERGIEPIDFWASARRRLQEGIGEEFDKSFNAIPASCDGKILLEYGYPDFAQYVNVNAGSWAEIRCEKGGSLYVECKVSGWDMETVRDQCLVPTELVMSTTEAAEPEGLPWWYAIVLVLLALCCCCCGLCLCGRKPQEVQNKKYIDARKSRKSNHGKRKSQGSRSNRGKKSRGTKKTAGKTRGSTRDPKSPTASPGEDNPTSLNSEEDQELYE